MSPGEDRVVRVRCRGQVVGVDGTRTPSPHPPRSWDSRPFLNKDTSRSRVDHEPWFYRVSRTVDDAPALLHFTLLHPSPHPRPGRSRGLGRLDTSHSTRDRAGPTGGSRREGRRDRATSRHTLCPLEYQVRRGEVWGGVRRSPTLTQTFVYSHTPNPGSSYLDSRGRLTLRGEGRGQRGISDTHVGREYQNPFPLGDPPFSGPSRSLGPAGGSGMGFLNGKVLQKASGLLPGGPVRPRVSDRSPRTPVFCGRPLGA